MTIVASPRVLLTELADGSGVLLDLDTKFYFTLNPVGVAAWRALSATGGATIDAVTRVICEEFDVSADVAQADLEALVRGLDDDGLVKLTR
ncbi:MAG: PqqD family protein [Polyangiaceae bacterium]|nr:PqqD family protein [Polyangiaceae bacterium]